MKIIISHDVDHLNAWEHWRDLMLPKFLLRSCIEYGLGWITVRELLIRVGRIALGRWENIEDLMAFDCANQVPSTFFVGMGNGRQLSYPFAKSVQWVNRIQASGFGVGVHGIDFKNPAGIRREFERFKQASKMDRFGIRMHCLMRDDDTLEWLERAGYHFDSSVMGLERPYRIGRLWVMPLQVMDGEIFCTSRRWQGRNLRQAKAATLQVLEQAKDRGLPYFNILFHDFYYYEGFLTWKKWYEWLIHFLHCQSYQFVSFRQAVAELEEAGSMN